LKIENNKAIKHLAAVIGARINDAAKPSDAITKIIDLV